MNNTVVFPDNDELSYLVNNQHYNTEGLAEGFRLRRHKHEFEADEGSREARTDWSKHIGPPTVAGCCNPFSGHFNALVLPTCLPERLRIISYIFEYAFLHDVVMESAAQAEEFHEESDFASRGLDLELRSMIGSKQIQSKMILELMSIDSACAQVCIDAWKTMIDTTSRRNKDEPFTSMEEYIEYRIVDCGAPFVDKHMCFGMGITLNPQELRQVEHIAHEAYAALALANDYFSFDVEYEEFKESDRKATTNAVWLYMHWYGIDIAQAKRLTRDETRKHELQFLDLQKQAEPWLTTKLRHYVQGLAFHIAGNVAWSTDNPRYHPENDIYRNNMTDFDRSLAAYYSKEKDEISGRTAASSVDCQTYAISNPSETSVPGHCRKVSIDSSSLDCDAWSEKATTISSRTSITELSDIEQVSTKKHNAQTSSMLGVDVISAPFEYINSLPSKGARDTFIDALAVWTPTTICNINHVKETIKSLHNISLMLDDVEDGSELRRGQPSTHMIFGLPQTINSAGYFVLEALKQLRDFDPECMRLALEHVQDLYLGQGFDLYWTRQGVCPSEDEYLAMVDKKTGGLFRLAAQLLQRLSHRDDITLEPFIQLLGQFFQIRDDYNNLVDQTYTDQKGFCEDLDEGKYSFPLVHALQNGKQNIQLQALLQSRRDNGGMSKEAKVMILQQLDACGSMAYTKRRLQEMHVKMHQEMSNLERTTRRGNWIMRLLLHKLQV